MRICFISEAHSYHTKYWMNVFSKSGLEIDLFSPTPSMISGITVHSRSFYDPNPLRCIVNSIRTRKALTGLQPDIYHLFGLFALSSLFTMPLILRIPRLVVSVWGSDVISYPSEPSLKERWIRWFLLNQADIVTATSKYLAKRAKRYLRDSRRIMVIPWGVDLSRYRSLQQKSNKQTINIGFAKRLHLLAGPDLLLEAFNLAVKCRNKSNLRLHIAGDGPLRDSLQKKIRERSLQDQVIMHGWIPPGKAMRVFLEKLDIFVMPSRQETFGVAAVEAMASGLPVIASNCGGIPEVVEHGITGLLCKPESPASLAEAILLLSRNRDLRLRMGDHGRRKATREFDVNNTINLFSTCYDRLINRKTFLKPSELEQR